MDFMHAKCDVNSITGSTIFSADIYRKCIEQDYSAISESDSSLQFKEVDKISPTVEPWFKSFAGNLVGSLNSAPCAGLRRSNSLELLPEAQFDMLSVDEHNAAGQMKWSGELKNKKQIQHKTMECSLWPGKGSWYYIWSWWRRNCTYGERSVNIFCCFDFKR